ncbi:acyl-CoA dehydrogenase family protein [Mycobacterium sp. CVI_P3]|uniref:Acyl-CoA dehydrogenase family protein n=1 Tax=Mycobacterium pinniadriaticum TaxID=2994102 RepID=A0ABT3SHF5_9MYCO|nr:acyl-CoA dehydrogenase family protein [Mycobacterium pinniadriaticum]MCX2931887.1 acyl-CoA dehydrogenase family protein [Mycobacterium pinniadriaticum]MCX2938302.1 acyl-CoA dehydrogenase family protein [Mycobacterium pinniadriaticum]
MSDDFAALCANEPELAGLRASVRTFLAADRDEFGWQPTVDAWLSSWDEEFSARLGDAGFLGLTIPREYGGHGLSHLHRYVVTEELLAAGAPVAAHWIADRQVAPGLLAYGTEEQRQRLLPRIAAGRYFSAIGMSEPQAGSDLAASVAKATRTDGGWLLSGTKVWTSGAHLAHQIVVLARTSPVDPQRRHAGFSQFIVPTDAEPNRGSLRSCPPDGLTISPIVMMSGEHHFNEVTFDEVFVSDANVLGEIGAGWHQVTAELSFERSGPERILSTAPLLTALVRLLATQDDLDDHAAAAVGDLLARIISLRQLSVSVARALAAGQSPVNEAALVKDLGTRFEQESVELAADLFTYVASGAPGRERVAALLDIARLHSPLFTLRGGTNEVLRGVVARGMGLR